MASIKTCIFLAAFTITTVAGHGLLTKITIGGTSYQGYNPSSGTKPPPLQIGWLSPENKENGFVDGNDYSNPDIICHKGATPPTNHGTVAAGGTVDLQWNTWPESHHGPVITYLANCNGPCSSVGKASLKFVKIAESGLLDKAGGVAPGKWATDEMLANGLTVSVTIPATIAAGKYVLRHEIIALHGGYNPNGAQNYPQCINLEITGSGTDNPPGVAGEALYSPEDPGIRNNIWQTPVDYPIPGPPLYGGGGGSSMNGTKSSNSTGSSRSGSKIGAGQFKNATDTGSKSFAASSSDSPVSLHKRRQRRHV